MIMTVRVGKARINSDRLKNLQRLEISGICEGVYRRGS